MDLEPIKTEEDYRVALREIKSLMTAEPGSPEGERLDVLVTLVEAYERRRFPSSGRRQKLLERMRERATSGMSTQEIMALTRQED